MVRSRQRRDGPEQEWLAQYKQGQVEALGKLVEHYRRPLFGFILKMTEGRGDADEIFQEVWFRVVKNLDKYRNQSFLSWMFRIAHNLIIDRARKRKPDASLQDHDEDQLPLESRIKAPGLGPDERAGGEDLGRRIARAVEKLPDKQKEVFLMRTEGDLSFKEIAAIQKSSINTALARMQYALSKLRENLKEEYDNLKRV